VIAIVFYLIIRSTTRGIVLLLAAGIAGLLRSNSDINCGARRAVPSSFLDFCDDELTVHVGNGAGGDSFRTAASSLLA